MDSPVPPHLEAAKASLLDAIEQLEKKPVDPLTTPWPELERSVIKILRGAFQLQDPQHQAVALGLSAFFAARLEKDHQAFWFLNRESIEGASLGFPETLMTVSPFGAVVESLSRAKLDHLDEVAKQLRTALAQVKFSGGAPQRLTAADYQRLFDPGFVQFIAIDEKKAANAWDAAPDKIIREVRDALSRTAKMPPEAKQQFEAQIVGALQRLDPNKTLVQQADRAGRIAELMGHLFGTVAISGSAPEEFWSDLAMPLLHIGVPDTFPPLDAEELKAARHGVDPFFLFLESVPYSHPGPEEGLFGTFALEELRPARPEMGQGQSPRLIGLKKDSIRPLLEKFDAQKTRDAVERFVAYVSEKSAKPASRTPDAAQALDAAVTLLAELKKVVQADGELYMRRTTEAEAASEATLGLVRQALQGPRIILTT